jgi:hypothetical protein
VNAEVGAGGAGAARERAIAGNEDADVGAVAGADASAGLSSGASTGANAALVANERAAVGGKSRQKIAWDLERARREAAERARRLQDLADRRIDGLMRAFLDSLPESCRLAAKVRREGALAADAIKLRFARAKAAVDTLSHELAAHYEALGAAPLAELRQTLEHRGFLALPPVKDLALRLTAAARELVRTSATPIKNINRSPGRGQGKQSEWEDKLASVTRAATRIIEAVLGPECMQGRRASAHASHPFFINEDAECQRVHRDQPYLGVSFFLFLVDADEDEAPVVLPGTLNALHLPKAPQARSDALQELPRKRFCAREGILLYFFAGFLPKG